MRRPWAILTTMVDSARGRLRGRSLTGPSLYSVTCHRIEQTILDESRHLLVLLAELGDIVLLSLRILTYSYREFASPGIPLPVLV